MKPLIIQGSQAVGKSTLANKIAEMYASEPLKLAFTKDMFEIFQFVQKIDRLQHDDDRLIIIEEVPTIDDVVFLNNILNLTRYRQPIIYITQDTAPVPDGFNSILLERGKGYASRYVHIVA